MLRKYFVCTDKLESLEIIDRYTRRPALGFSTSKRIGKDGEFMLAVNLSREDKRKVRIRASGKKLIVKTTLDRERIPLYSAYDHKSDVTYADVVFDEQEVCFIELEEFKQIKSERLLSVEFLKDFNVDEGDNTLVVEKVADSVDGGEFSDENYAIFATPEFYNKIDKKPTNSILTARYKFVSNIANIDGAYLLCEDNECEVYFNGRKVERVGYEIDKSFGKCCTFDCGNCSFHKYLACLI